MNLGSLPLLKALESEKPRIAMFCFPETTGITFSSIPLPIILWTENGAGSITDATTLTPTWTTTTPDQTQGYVTTSFRAMDCTLPADRPVFFIDLNVFQRTGENVNPTIRSIALLALCASTKL